MSLNVKDTFGSPRPLLAPGIDPTFRAVYSVAAASVITGHDILAIALAASPTVRARLKRIRAVLLGDGTNQSAAPHTVKLTRRTTNNSGGTLGTAPTIVPDNPDAAAPAAQVAVKVWTANPTDGTLKGVFAESALYVNAAAGVGIGVSEAVFDFTRNTDDAPALALATDSIGVQLGSALPTTSTLLIEVVWSESAAPANGLA